MLIRETTSKFLVLVLSFLPFLFLPLNVIAQGAPTWRPVMTAGGSGHDGAVAAKADGAGNIFVGGVFSAAATFGDKTLTAAGNTDMYLARYSKNRLEWIVQLGGETEDVLSDFALDNRGNIYVTGWTSGPSQFGSTNGEPRSHGLSGQNIFIAKYTPEGALLWLQTGSASQGMNRGHGIAVDPETGSCFVTGMAQTPTTFSSTSGETHQVPGPWTWHMVLVRYSSTGNFIWGQSNQASPNSVAYKVAIDSELSSYVTGWLESRVSFSSADGRTGTVDGFSRPVQSPPYLGDAFLVKYDSNGNFKWVNHVGGYKANGIDVAVSPRGFVTFTGMIGNFNDGDLRHASSVVTSQDGEPVNLGGGSYSDPFNRDAFLATYDYGGKLLFAERIGGPREDLGSSLFYDQAGDLYFSGGFSDLLAVGGMTLRGKGAANLFLLKYSSNTDSPLPSGPQLAWAKSADNAFEFDPPQGHPRMGLTPEGNLLLAGSFSDSTNFDGDVRRSAGLSDSFAVELFSNEPLSSPDSTEPREQQEESIFDSVSRWFSKAF